MKRLARYSFYCLFGLLVLGPQQSYGQSVGSSKSTQLNQEELMKELVDEVRQLRMDLGRMTLNAYRAQALIERLRLQQEQVNRVTLDLSKVRSQISDLKSARLELKEKAAEMQKRVDVGVSPEPELNALKGAIADLNRREPDLTERESQLTSDLNVLRANLEEFNKRLDDIERELQTIGKVQEDKAGKRVP